MQDIIIVGAGGMGREVLGILKNINAVSPTWNILGFVDDSKTTGDTVNNTKILGGINYLETIANKTAVVIAVALTEVRKKLRNSITNNNIYFPSIIHPSVLITHDEFVSVGEGCILCANTVLTTNINIKDFVILNVATTIHHDAVVESYSTLMPGVNISTGAKIEEGCYIGTGCKISKPETIPAWSNLTTGTIIA